MSPVEMVGAIAPQTPSAITHLGSVARPVAVQGTQSFADILSAGVAHVDQKLSTADTMVRQFALDDSIPVHRVTYALEEARLSVELAMQVRTRMVEAYRELMGMQL